ncbi:nickel pincer cofactor biosynthesis protein LarC [Sporolituus thermophilus]|uniref:Pyridinium-3,5-bisthiocarboxylic acid mononucleotide nickel insertion protein n=1 Tax=Sporolituus thermophilus DSM 23256 TaxID=1123285 RepID=A0A1G7IRP7_9FIRM|nr:nickel pincer cofactor biosynthesis protein LarC [Sporolituus thermophilus]SDF14979.1 hypothetical protein SAMN05660235_00592 [Sporolituus thermophilus DSM 23256]
MKAIYLDCFSGISGNMMIGALLDAGLPIEHLRAELAKLDLSAYRLIDKDVVKKGIRARYFNVEFRQWFQPSRNFSDIQKIIEKSSLSKRVKEQAEGIFSRLAAAEAKVHGTSVDKVHFHEVGAIDSIVDIVGTAIGLEYLGIEQVFASALHVGSGYVKCSHGLMPVPAPATAELLQGIPFYSDKIKGELVTPTGAALVASLVQEFGAVPERMKTERVAYGAGSMDLDIPNVLRVYLGTVQMEAKGQRAKLVETNMDDLNPQIYGYVMERLFAAGAYDVYLTPVIMKKNRPGTKLTVMISPDKLNEVVRLILTETSTLGVRILDCDSYHVARETVTVDTPWGAVRVKIGRLDGRIINIAPEFEDCRTIAERHNIPLKAIHSCVLGKCQVLIEGIVETK